MKHYSRYITLAGGILALFSFALPWDEDYSGVEFANMSFNSITVIFSHPWRLLGQALY